MHVDTGHTLDGIPPSLCGHVEQGVDVIADSENMGIFDTLFGILHALMPGQSIVGGGGVMARVGAGTSTAVSVMADMGEVPLTVLSELFTEFSYFSIPPYINLYLFLNRFYVHSMDCKVAEECSNLHAQMTII